MIKLFKRFKELGILETFINMFTQSVDGSKIIEFFNSLDISAQKYIVTSGKLNKNQLEFIKNNLQWIDSTDGIKTTISGLTEKELEQAVATATVSGSQTTSIATTNGLSVAFKGLAISIKKATASLIGFLTNPIVAPIAAMTAGVIALTAVNRHFQKSAEKSREELEETVESYKTVTDELKSLQDEYQTTKERIEELQALAGAGTISLSEKEELENLKRQNEQLERKIELKKQEQITSAKQVLRDTKKASDKKVQSEYDGFWVDPEEELNRAISRYNTYTYNGDEKAAAKAEKRIQEMLDLINPMVDAYEDLTNAGYELNTEEQEQYDRWKKAQEGYLDYVHSIDSSLETFKELSEEQQKLKLTNYLKDNGLSDSQANSVVNEIKPEDYSKLYNTNIPKLSDFTEAENFGKEYGKAWIDAVNSEIADSDINVDALDFSTAFNTSEVKDDLLELARSGEITSSVLESTEKYAELLNETGLNGEQAKDKITELLSQQERLAAASKGMSKLNDAYDEFKDKSFVTAETLESLPQVFKDLEGYDLFSEIVGNPKSGSDEIQNAFNQIVTEYIKSQNTLSGLVNASEADIQTIIANLKELGITNAEEVIEATRASLQESRDMLAKAEQEYINYLNGKLGYTEEYINSEASLNGQLVSALGSAYKQDYDNWVKLLQTKQTAYNNWVGALNNSLSSIQGKFKAAASGVKNQWIVGAQVSGLDNKMLSHLKMQKNLAESAFNNLSNLLSIDFTKANASFGNFSYSGVKDGSGGSGSGSGTGSGSDSDTKETFNWIETAISRIQRAITNLGKTVSATYKSWSTRNNALASEISNINKEISLQQQAYDYYMKKANSVGLSSYYQNLVQNGAIKIDDISDENLAEKIKNYKEFYESALECSDAIIDLRDNLADMASQKFDNVAKEYEDKLSMYEHQVDMLESSISQVEERGYIISTSYYEQLINIERQNLTVLNSEYNALIKARSEAMSTGEIKEWSEEWVNMTSDIQDVEKSILEANTALIEYSNTIRELNWEVFDKLQEKISEIVSESEFLINLMSNDKLFNENGNFTDQGRATLGLHAVNYNTYMSQADDYAKELLKINEEIANDPYNQTLLERRKELLDAQRENILAAEDEKQSIKDLISDGYDSFLDYMSKLIDARKDLLQTTKDLYDYEKNVSEQTAEIARLQKILNFYNGNDSEEARASIQKYEVQLKEAKDNLRETEYEKYISDQEQILDSLYDQASEWVNSRLDNIDGLIQEVVQSTNDNASTIKETLEKETDAVGTMLSTEMNNIWSGNGGIKDVVSIYNDNFSNHATTINNTLLSIKASIDSMVKASDKTASSGISGGTGNNSTSNSGGSTSSSGSSSGTSSSSSSTSSSSSNSSGKWGSWFITKRDSYPKEKLKTNSSLVDRLKFNDISSSFSDRLKYYKAMGGSGTYTGSSSQNRWMLNLMKSNGYKIGSRNIPSNQMNWIHEGEIVYRPSDGGILFPLESNGKVWTEEMANNLWNMAQNNVTSSIPKYNFNNLPTVSNNTGDVSLTIGDIQMYGVNNPTEFATQLKNALKNDPNVLKIIRSDSLGSIMGKPSVTKHIYK